jgi:ElaB/YqjD/DUF883 family membrane-anchored ribosome-binding protein
MISTHLTGPTHSRARQSFDDLAGSVRDLRHEVAPLLDRVGDGVSVLASRSLDAVRSGGHQLQDRARRASDPTARRIRDEPLKSVLIAALAGGLLVALVGLGQRLRDRR